MNSTHLLLGSNLDIPAQHLAEARRQIAGHLGTILQESSLYQTAAWGNADQPDFINQVVVIETPFNPQELMQKILDIEKMSGRIRVERNEPRTLDIDILFFNDPVINEANLIIPHPEIQNRRFALVPLQEVSPHYRHPTLNKTVSELLDRCSDTLSAKKI